MICFQIIHLLLEKNGPQILAEKLDNIEIVGETGAIARKSARGEDARGICQLHLRSVKPRSGRLLLPYVHWNTCCIPQVLDRMCRWLTVPQVLDQLGSL